MLSHIKAWWRAYMLRHAPHRTCGRCSYCKRIITTQHIFYIVHRTGMTSDYRNGHTKRRMAFACYACGPKRRIEKRSIKFV